jgi:serralysin
MHLRGAQHLAAVSVLGLGWLLLGFPVSALAAGGQLDPTFGGDGKVTTHFAGETDAAARAVAIQTDGKLVVAGDSFGSVSADRFALARYKLDGSLDSSFGGDGKVRTHFAGESDAAASAVAIQADGKIVAAGYSFVGFNRFALARYNLDGSLDSSFGGDGKVITHFAEGSSDVASAVAIQTDGQIVAAGRSQEAGQVRFALARYNPNGALDSSFGADGNGRVTTQFPGSALASALAIQDDGKIVAAGASQVSHRRFALARYDSNGTLDPSFGADGDGKVGTRFA